MIFFIAPILTIVCLSAFFIANDDTGEFIGVIGTLIFGAATVIMLIVIIGNAVSVKGYVAACEQRYEILTYQLENDLYDNDNDLGKKELYNEIQAWNEDLAKGKALQHDFWIGIFYPNVYDQFDFIELP